MPWYVYVLRCGDGTLYTGIATDVTRRLHQHRNGLGAKYTRGRGPFSIVYRKRLSDRSAALKQELRIKSLPRVLKLSLLRDYTRRRVRKNA